ncbi:9271_t:CDS:2 [Paraglomus occultum]|uniref:9271_t:CDS:1 n=1 Tax=Paraglomus occultum TaxID=144539 RepID=A0A9N9FE96_9GLOM|nr:9271_t:CDS:2 [Paraglomus occultum]
MVEEKFTDRMKMVPWMHATVGRDGVDLLLKSQLPKSSVFLVHWVLNPPDRRQTQSERRAAQLTSPQPQAHTQGETLMAYPQTLSEFALGKDLMQHVDAYFRRTAIDSILKIVIVRDISYIIIVMLWSPSINSGENKELTQFFTQKPKTVVQTNVNYSLKAPNTNEKEKTETEFSIVGDYVYENLRRRNAYDSDAELALL